MKRRPVTSRKLGGDGIRVNAINADQIETPLFLKFVEEAGAEPRGFDGGTAEELPEPEPTGPDDDSAGSGGRPRGAAGERQVPLTTGDILTVDGGLPEGFPR